MALNIADLFEHAADAVPERLAVACGDAEVTYRELDERSTRLAHFLAGRGVTAGDHVGVYGRNSIELIAAFLACYKLRAIAVNINYRYVEAELRYLFTEAELAALVHDRQFSTRVAGLLPEYPGIRAVLAIDDGSGAPLAESTDFEAALAGQPAGRDFGRAQRGRHLHAVHGRDHRVPEGRPVAPRGHLADPGRRHRLRHRRADAR